MRSLHSLWTWLSVAINRVLYWQRRPERTWLSNALTVEVAVGPRRISTWLVLSSAYQPQSFKPYVRAEISRISRAAFTDHFEALSVLLLNHAPPGAEAKSPLR